MSALLWLKFDLFTHRQLPLISSLCSLLVNVFSNHWYGPSRPGYTFPITASLTTFLVLSSSLKDHRPFTFLSPLFLISEKFPQNESSDCIKYLRLGVEISVNGVETSVFVSTTEDLMWIWIMLCPRQFRKCPAVVVKKILIKPVITFYKLKRTKISFKMLHDIVATVIQHYFFNNKIIFERL